jgi:hypothetical protein
VEGRAREQYVGGEIAEHWCRSWALHASTQPAAPPVASSWSIAGMYGSTACGKPGERATCARTSASGLEREGGGIEAEEDPPRCFPLVHAEDDVLCPGHRSRTQRCSGLLSKRAPAPAMPNTESTLTRAALAALRVARTGVAR